MSKKAQTPTPAPTESPRGRLPVTETMRNAWTKNAPFRTNVLGTTYEVLQTKKGTAMIRLVQDGQTVLQVERTEQGLQVRLSPATYTRLVSQALSVSSQPRTVLSQVVGLQLENRGLVSKDNEFIVQLNDVGMKPKMVQDQIAYWTATVPTTAPAGR